MAPLAKTLAVAAAAVLAAPALVAANPIHKLEARQQQDPNTPLVVNNPACDFYRCYIFWEPGTQVAVNWLNPPSGTVQVDLMLNNNTQVGYNIVQSVPAVSNTCDAGNGFGQPGPNGATCGGFVFEVPSSWNAGNYSGLRAMSIQNQDLQSFTDMITIIHNSTTKNDVPFSIVSGSTSGGSSSTAAASSTGSSAAGGAKTTSGSSSASASKSSGASMTGSSSGSTASQTSSTAAKNGAMSNSASSATVLTVAAALVAGVASLL